MTAQQLKNSILQMAVQGKLVPQDPNDEPASVLLQKIRKEKEQMIKDGKIKKEKNPSFIFRGDDGLFYEKIGNNEPVCIDDEAPFEIPDSWEWVRIKNFCIDIFSGKSPKYEKQTTEYRIIGQAANQQDEINYDLIKYTNATFWGDMPDKYFLREYDVLLNTLGNGTLGRAGIIKSLPFKLLTDGHLFVFRNINSISSEYFYYFLLTIQDEIIKTANGSTNQTFLNLNTTKEWLIPVPPIEEQKRIVNKIDELMPLVASYNYEDTKINQLDKSLPDQLKKSIFQTAVQGKLIPQDPNDEATSALLRRIHDEKEQLIKDGKIKQDKNESVIYKRDGSYYEKVDGKEHCIDNEIPFEIPDSWEWARMGTIVSISSGNGLTSDKMDKTGPYPVYGGNGIMGYHTDFNVNRPTLVIGRVGYYCGSTHITPEKAWVTDNAFITRFSENNMYMQWLKLFIDSLELRNRASSTAQPVVSGKLIYPILIPIPPLAEQKRIVAKINPLFVDIDTLKNCVTG